MFKVNFLENKFTNTLFFSSDEIAVVLSSFFSDWNEEVVTFLPIVFDNHQTCLSVGAFNL